ncbi:citrate synthase [Propioniciclava sp. MC1595]|uniref:citrate synthase n=1 Tax=Propioniciclava sp. MC1595 TaxID=2760308 RepID=UPI0016624F78|nr:citrate synthase [Propioniciclava sp. MC1595]MBB1495626.1 citrate synthase [Propioniciclava sp. MC1595]QTE26054.1 citrate synthase [Propioniciclava sp. MC1595]
MTTPATFSAGDKNLELPFVQATQGNNGYDISKLMAQTGDTTFDIGFANTAVCKSAITYIDGDKGVLQYRGYPIEQLAEKSTFLETSYLVLYGELPTKEQLEDFTEKVANHMVIDERIREMFRIFPRKSHPMPVLSAGVTALGLFSQDTIGFDDDRIDAATHRLMAKVPTIAAYSYKNSIGMPTLYPDYSLSYVENFLRMSFGTVSQPYELDDEVVKAMEVLLILHADHEQNCSTSTVRLVGSAQTNLYQSVSSGVNALYGPLHGGANQAVLEMLDDIADRGISVKDYVNKVKDKSSNERLMGFGHRVYKNYDPRAAIIKKHADAILRNRAGGNDQLLDIALELEEAALSDPYFVERKLYPNVDFYTGLIYRAMGFPTDMFTVLFAIGRLPGWIAQWREMIKDPTNKIGRPRQIYIGHTERDYVPMDAR